MRFGVNSHKGIHQLRGADSLKPKLMTFVMIWYLGFCHSCHFRFALLLGMQLA